MDLPERLSELYHYLHKVFSGAGVMTAEQDSRKIIQVHTGQEWADIIARPDQRVAGEALRKIKEDSQRRVEGAPISRIYGEREFWGLNFKICADTLDPRPDTEVLVDVALKRFKGAAPLNILDLGTGSGCILIALLTEFQSAQGVGVDQSLNVLKTARFNAQQNHVAGRAHFYCGSWGQAVGQKFDLIVSNPPYISNQIIPTLAKEVQNHDPILALDGGEDGLDAYKNIFKEVNFYLKPGGMALFEIGYDQQEDVVRLAEESGFFVRDVHHDFAGLPRVVEISGGDK